MCHMPCPPHPPYLYLPNYIWGRMPFMKVLIKDVCTNSYMNVCWCKHLHVQTTRLCLVVSNHTLPTNIHSSSQNQSRSRHYFCYVFSRRHVKFSARRKLWVSWLKFVVFFVISLQTYWDKTLEEAAPNWSFKVSSMLHNLCREGL
jgi:hypothetical protein